VFQPHGASPPSATASIASRMLGAAARSERRLRIGGYNLARMNHRRRPASPAASRSGRTILRRQTGGTNARIPLQLRSTFQHVAGAPSPPIASERSYAVAHVARPRRGCFRSGRLRWPAMIASVWQCPQDGHRWCGRASSPRSGTHHMRRLQRVMRASHVATGQRGFFFGTAPITCFHEATQTLGN
jgi:hypothetical protein